MFFNPTSLRFLLLVFSIMPFMLGSSSSDIAKARELYRKAAHDEKSAISLQSLGAKYPSDPLFLGYEGTAIAIRASFASVPWKKYNLLKDGLSKINQAVTLQTKNIELRTLRLSVESQIPSFVPFEDHQSEDIQFVKSNYDPTHPLSDVMRKFAKIK